MRGMLGANESSSMRKQETRDERRVTRDAIAARVEVRRPSEGEE